MKHNFGVIEKFEEDKWYSDYEPKKYNCISVSDDLIEGIVIRKVKNIFSNEKASRIRFRLLWNYNYSSKIIKRI